MFAFIFNDMVSFGTQEVSVAYISRVLLPLSCVFFFTVSAHSLSIFCFVRIQAFLFGIVMLQHSLQRDLRSFVAAVRLLWFKCNFSQHPLLSWSPASSHSHSCAFLPGLYIHCDNPEQVHTERTGSRLSLKQAFVVSPHWESSEQEVVSVAAAAVVHMQVFIWLLIFLLAAFYVFVKSLHFPVNFSESKHALSLSSKRQRPLY